MVESGYENVSERVNGFNRLVVYVGREVQRTRKRERERETLFVCLFSSVQMSCGV